MKRAFSLLLAILIAGTSAFAQVAVPKRVRVQVLCNVPGAQVFLDGEFIGMADPELIAMVIPGGHQLRITKPGFDTLDMQVAINPGNTVIRPQLTQSAGEVGKGDSSGAKGKGDGAIAVPKGGGGVVAVPKGDAGVIDVAKAFELSVNSNVGGAQVFLNGSALGQTPLRTSLPAGSYTITVKAPGYLDYSQSIAVNGPARVDAVLQAMSFQVQVSANVGGAQVFINGQAIGQAPCAAALVPGSYTLLVKAPGYLDYQAPLAVNGPQSLSVSLMPATSSWELRVPEALFNRDGGAKGILVWVDGVLQGGGPGRAAASGQLTPGRHTVRLAAGGLVTETQVDIQLGRAYVFEPFLGLTVK